MMIKTNILKIFMVSSLAVSLLSTTAFAADTQNTAQSPETNKAAGENATNKTIETEAVIADYKKYVAGVSLKIRGEIVEYRKNVAKLNKQKRELYHQLSEDAQAYLEKEQSFRKKLPLNQKRLINIQNPGEKPQKDQEQK